jgi:hypothetical protein
VLQCELHAEFPGDAYGGEDVVGKITGMILDIKNMNEIIDILESPSRLEERIIEAYELFEKNK